MFRDPDQATNCNRGGLSSDTNRKSEQTVIVCLLSLSLFDALFKLLSLPQPCLAITKKYDTYFLTKIDVFFQLTN